MSNIFSANQLTSNSNFDVSLVTQTVKNLPAMQETQEIQEAPLEKEMATHSGILAWRIPWIEEPGRLWSTGSDMTEVT